MKKAGVKLGKTGVNTEKAGVKLGGRCGHGEGRLAPCYM